LNRDFTAAERRDGLEIESLLGSPCTVAVKEKPTKSGGTFAAIDAVTPHMKACLLLKPELDPNWIPFGSSERWMGSCRIVTDKVVRH